MAALVFAFFRHSCFGGDFFFADEGTGCCGSLDGPATSSGASSGLLRSCAF